MRMYFKMFIKCWGHLGSQAHFYTYWKEERKSRSSCSTHLWPEYNRISTSLARSARLQGSSSLSRTMRLFVTVLAGTPTARKKTLIGGNTSEGRRPYLGQ